MTFTEAMAAGSRLLDVRATITCVDTYVINATGSHIMGFSVDDGGQMPLGTAVSARYTLELSNADGEWLRNGSMLGNRSLTGARVKVEMAVHHDGAWDWQSVGVFIVDRTSAREQDTRMRLIGNDPLAALDVLFDDSLVYRSTTTLNDILTHIRSKGVTINGTLATNGGGIVNYTPDWGDDATIREVLCYVAQLGGCFVRCDREGVVELVPLNGSTTHAITTSTYLNFTDDERYFNFNRIKVQPLGAKKDKTYVESAVNAVIPESAANTLVIENNPLFKTKTTYSYYKASTWREGRQYYTRSGGKYTAVSKDIADESSLGLYYQRSTNYNTTNLQTMVTNLKTALTGVAFRAIDFTWLGNPAVRVGDKAALTDTRGVTTTAIIVQQRLSFEDGTFRAQVSCPLDLEAVTPATITASGRVVSTAFGVGTIDGSVIIPQSMTGAHLIDGTITNSNIAGGTITGTEIADSTITGSKIDASTFTNGFISGTAIDTSTFTNGSISGTAIDASTFANGSISGTAIDTSTFVDGTIDGSKITDSTIENSHFVAGTIEGSSIKGGTIDGTHIYNGTADNLKITNASIQNGAITTAKIQDAQITNAKIAAAGIDFANIKDVVAGTSIFRQGVGDALYLDRLVVNDANFASAIAGKLMIRDTDGKLYRISVNSSGAVTATQVQVNGDSLTDNAVMSVSQRLLWRQATQPSAPWVGMLWLDTTAEKLKRCTAITPSVAWEVVPAGEVHTAVIDVDDNGMNILSGGNLNLLSGGSLNIKNLGDTANVINMDNTGLTLSSTGQLKLQSTDSIIIGGSPFGVGGTNLLAGTSETEAQAIFSGWQSSQLHQIPPQNIELLKKGGTFTLSVYLRNIAGTEEVGAGIHLTKSSGYWQANKTSIAPGGEGIFSHTFEVPADPSYTSGYMHLRHNSSTAGSSTVMYSRFKLEKGTMATDWSPSPQDTVDALDALDGRLGDVETRVQVFYQASKPTYTAVGDIWYDTDSNPLEIWKCTNVSTQAHSAFTDPVLTRALAAATTAQNTANGKINTFVGSNTPTALAAGDLWLDTGNKNIWKRATVAGTGGWVQYLTAAGYLITTGVTIDGTDLTVKATGNLNLNTDANLNVQSGGNLNVLNGGDIEISNGGDINVASGGKITLTTPNDLVLGAQNITAFADERIDAKANTIDLSANDSIKLTVKSLGEGGTNLIPNSDFSNGWTGWTNYSGATLSTSEYTMDGVKRPGYVICPAGDTIAGAYIDIPYSAASNQSMTLSFFAYLNSTIISLHDALVSLGQIIQYDASDAQLGTVYYHFANFSGTSGWQRMTKTFDVLNTCKTLRIYIFLRSDGISQNQLRVTNFQLERGTVATTWKPSLADPASGVKTSSVEVNTNGIYMDTTGDFNVNAGVNLSIKGGSGANSIGISNNPTDTYFMWAGNASAASAPFSVKRDGSVKATKIQHEYSQSFWDMADATFPAEFPVYIPSGYTVDSVTFTFQTKKARTFAKSAASGGGVVNTDSGGGTAGIDNITVTVNSASITTTGAPNHTHSTSTDPSGSAGAHSHTNSHGHSASADYSMVEHTHKINLPTHTHGLNYGINEKTTLATSCVLKVGATTIGTYSPNPSAPVEIKAHMSAGWNTVTVAPNNDARIVAYAMVKLTPA